MQKIHTTKLFRNLWECFFTKASSFLKKNIFLHLTKYFNKMLLELRQSFKVIVKLFQIVIYIPKLLMHMHS